MVTTTVNEKDKTLGVSFPLTEPKGSARVKRTDKDGNEFEVATKQIPFRANDHIEHQIGFEAKLSDAKKSNASTLRQFEFKAINGQYKCPSQLSEWIFHFRRWGFISKEELDELKSRLAALRESDFISNDSSFMSTKTPGAPLIRNADVFETEYAHVPIYRFFFTERKKDGLYFEIRTEGRQNGVGVQPMLYFCVPVTELKSDEPLVSRTAKTNEKATLVLNSNAKPVLLKLLEYLGSLSPTHNGDIVSIINVIEAALEGIPLISVA